MTTTTDWLSFYQYATEDTAAKGDGYWLFVPMFDGDVELFQVSTMVTGEAVTDLSTTVVTADGVRRHDDRLARGATPAPHQVAVRHADQFRLEAGPNLTISSDDPSREYRVETHDPANGVSADLRVRPAMPLFWDIVGSDYRTTLDSTVDGTITIDGKVHEVASLCAFEHSSWMIPTRANPAPAGAMPPFWHYEYIQWTGGDRPFGTFLWHRLGPEGERVDASEFHSSGSSGHEVKYDRYDIAYKDIADHGELALPGAWDVTATKDDETFSYRSKVRTVLSTASGPMGLSDFSLECEGVHRGPGGETQLRGRGRTEYIVIGHNPALR